MPKAPLPYTPGQPVVSLREAIAAGLPRYFTGIPCKHGHICERSVLNRSCIKCMRDRFTKWQVKATSAGYYREKYAADPEQSNSYTKKWYAKNPEHRRRYTREWCSKNPERAKQLNAEFYRNNREWSRTKNARRRAQKLLATPRWVDHDAIASVFAEAVRLELETGIKHHVDHIIPLVHSDVCGLHVPWNLQPMPASDNQRKNNRHWLDSCRTPIHSDSSS